MAAWAHLSEVEITRQLRYPTAHTGQHIMPAQQTCVGPWPKVGVSALWTAL